MSQQTDRLNAALTGRYIIERELGDHVPIDDDRCAQLLDGEFEHGWYRRDV